MVQTGLYYNMKILTFDHSSTVSLTLRAQIVRANSIGIVDTGHQTSIQRPLLVQLVVQQRLLSVVIFHLLQESREAANPGGVCLVVVVLGAKQVLTSRAAAAPDAGVSGRRGAAIGNGEGTVVRGVTVVGGEAIGKEGWL